MVLLPVYITSNNVKWFISIIGVAVEFYFNLIVRREDKIIIASYKPERIAKKRRLLQEKLQKIPIVNLHVEKISNAVDLLQLNCNVQEIVFEETTINHEMKFVKTWGNRDMLDYVHNSIQEYVMPIRMVYTNPIGGIDVAEDIKQFFKTRYPLATMFSLAPQISPIFIDRLLSKDIVLLGLCAYGHPYQKHIPVLMIAFEKEHDDIETFTLVPLYPEELMK
jgi:hypothetical protein